MDSNFVQTVENHILEYANEVLGWTLGEKLPKDLNKSLRARVERISDQFTSKRPLRFDNYFSNELDVAAYALYFHCANMVRFSSVLGAIHVPDSKKIRILDLGSATGAASMALVKFLQDRDFKQVIEVCLVDQSEKALVLAKRLFQKVFGATVLVTGLCKTFESLPLKESYDFYLLSNAINEVKVWGAFFDKIKESMHETSQLVIVEPAMLQLTRRLMESKTKLGLFVVAPCTHQETCPMLVAPSQWCHFEAFWEPPLERSAIEKYLGHKGGSLSYSYLVLQKQNPQTTGHRVVSNVTKSKIKKTLCVEVCGSGEWVDLYFDKKHKLSKIIQKGQTLHLQNEQKNKNGFQISGETEVRIENN